MNSTSTYLSLPSYAVAAGISAGSTFEFGGIFSSSKPTFTVLKVIS